MGINFSTGTQSYPGNTVIAQEHSLSGSSQVNWTGIPDGIKTMTLSFTDVRQTNTSSQILIQIGDGSAGIHTSGYLGTYLHQNLSGGAGGRQNTSGFELYQYTTNYMATGMAHMVLHDDGNTDYWVCTIMAGQRPNGYEHIAVGGGYRHLTGNQRLDRVRFRVESGTFNYGTATLTYSW